MIRILHQLVLPALVFISADVHSNDLLRDTTTMEQIRLGIDRIYNYEFDQAEYALNLLENNYPEHPVTSFYEGLIYYWKYYPLVPGQPGASEFEQAMQISWERAGRLKKNHQDIEGVFFELMSRAFIVMYYADNGRSSKVISHLGKIYRDILEGFDMQDEFKEFYFISGLYNYYREAYPEAYPIYKPAAIFFRKGDKIKGIEMLKYAAEESDFLRVEAALFLSLIYINFESKNDSAVFYASKLHQNFPGNGYFLSKYAEMLLVDHQYDAALDYVLQLMTLDDFNKMKGTIFMGIYEEKKLKDLEKARIYYEEGLRLAEAFNDRANYTKAYALIGLSRYFLDKGDNKQARTYKKEAKNASGYAYVFSD